MIPVLPFCPGTEWDYLAPLLIVFAPFILAFGTLVVTLVAVVGSTGRHTERGHRRKRRRPVPVPREW